MKPTRRLSRRSFLGRVAGGAVAAGAAMTVLGEPAKAFQCSDSDGGQYADPGGRGRRCGRGCSDSDSGSYADPGGRGRNCGRSGLTDGDSGSHSDPGGNGRGPRRGRATGVTDGDSGSHADRANFGRGPARR